MRFPTPTDFRNGATRLFGQLTGKGGGYAGGNAGLSGKRNGSYDADNLDSEKDNQNKPPYFPSTDETALAQLVEARMKASATHRKPFEARYKENLRFFQSDQWGQVTAANGYQDLRKPGDFDRVYSTANKIRPIVRKHIARLLGTEVNIAIAGLTGRSKDIAAAKQARSLHAHFEQVQDDEGMKAAAAEEGTAIGLVWRYDYWDSTIVVPLPDYDDDTGEIKDVTYEPAGDLCYELLSFADVYVDPRCRRMDLADAQWVIIACQRSIPAIRQAYPERGMRVKGTAGSEEHDSLRLELDSLTGNQNQDETSRQVATVLTLWEQPTKKHPQGLYAVVAGGVCLIDPQPWPYTEMRDPQRGDRFEFPVTPWGFDRGIESFWPDGLTSSLVDIQRRRNRYISKADNHTKNGDGKILSPRGAEISSDAFKSGRPNEVIEYTVDLALLNHKPELFETPNLDPSLGLNIQLADQDLADIGEVQSVDMGRAQSGTPGIVVNALLDASQSGVIISQKSWETFIETFCRKRLALAKQYYKIDRLIYTQDTAPESLIKQASKERDIGNGQMPQGMPGMGQPTLSMGAMPEGVEGAEPPTGDLDGDDPDEPNSRTQAMSFTDLAEGRYVVSATSNPPRSPSAKAQIITQFMQAGAFLPQNLTGTYIAFRALEIAQGEKWVDDVFFAAQIEQSKAAAAAKDQQVHDAAMAEAQQKAQEQQQAQLLQTQQGLKQADLAADQQKTTTTLQAQAQMGAAESQARGQTQVEVEKQRHENDLQKTLIDHLLNPPPKETPKGKGKT